MADAAAARREARRKRILENSHNRLDLIAGKKSSEDCSIVSSSTKYSYSDQIYESPAESSSRSSAYTEPINNGVHSSEPELLTFLSEPEPFITNSAGDTEIVNDFAGFTFPSTASTEATKEKSRLEKLITSKYDVVFIAILIQILYHTFIFESTYFFLPLVMYTVTKIIWFPASSNSSFASAVLLMHGISAGKAQKIMSIVQNLSEISQDIFIYLFTTICIQSLVIAVTDNFVNI